VSAPRCLTRQQVLRLRPASACERSDEPGCARLVAWHGALRLAPGAVGPRPSRSGGPAGRRSFGGSGGTAAGSRCAGFVGCDCKHEMRDFLVEALEQVVNDRLNYSLFEIIARERYDGVD
jgi:hypothetical protein